MLKLAPAALDDVLAFAKAFGVELYPWQVEAFGAACRREAGHFRYRLAGVSVPRGNGKSYAGALVGLWRLLCGPAPQDIISAALDSSRRSWRVWRLASSWPEYECSELLFAETTRKDTA
jgi:hypothetical protein